MSSKAEKAKPDQRPVKAAPIPVCIVCAHSVITGETPYCNNPAVKAEHDPLTGSIQPTCTDERTMSPTNGNRRVCGHLGVLFEARV